jgi:hypothetical protein
MVSGYAFAARWIYNARMERPADFHALNPLPFPPGGHRRMLCVAGALAALAGAIMGWQHGTVTYHFLRDLWLHTLLPAFHSLHISGLPFCF